MNFLKDVGKHKQKYCRGFTVSLQYALKILRKNELFHATLTDLRSLDVYTKFHSYTAVMANDMIDILFSYWSSRRD